MTPHQEKPPATTHIALACTGALLVAGAGSLAYAQSSGPADGDAVSAVLHTDPGGSAWWTGGRFTLRSDRTPNPDWQLRFTVAHGRYVNSRPDLVDVEQRGGQVTLTPRSGYVARTPGTEVGFGLQGDGTARPAITGCSLNGRAVQGCAMAPGDKPASAAAAELSGPARPSGRGAAR